MNKKFFSIAILIVFLAASLPLFAAYEARVVNIRAKISSAIEIEASSQDFNLGELEFKENGFQNPPTEYFNVALSDTFKNEPRVKGISYKIVKKAKGHNPQGTGYPQDFGHSAAYWNTHDLSPWLTIEKNSSEAENDTTTNATLNKSTSDLSDKWKISLPWIPPFEGYQPTGYTGETIPIESAKPGETIDYGTDLWIEITGFSY